MSDTFSKVEVISGVDPQAELLDELNWPWFARDDAAACRYAMLIASWVSQLVFPWRRGN